MLRVLICSFFLSLLACTPASVGEPPFDTEPLSKLIVDLHIMEGLSIEIPVTLRDSMKEVYFNHILEDHGFTEEKFDSLMWIVRSEPIWLENFYRTVSDKVAVLDAESKRVPSKVDPE